MTKANTVVGGSFQGDHVAHLPSGESGDSAPRHSGAVSSDRSRRGASPFDGSSGGSTGRAITPNGSGDIRCPGEGGEKTRSGKKSRRIPLVDGTEQQ